MGEACSDLSLLRWVSLFRLNIKKMSEDERKSFWELMAHVNCFAGQTFQGIVEG